MKKQTLLLLAIIISSTATLTAQVQKGDILLGATVGAYFNNNNTSGALSNSNLSPRIGLAIGDNSVLGLKTSVGYQTFKPESNPNRSHTITIGTSIYWRRYMPIKKQLGWYLEPSGGVSYENNVQKYSNGETKNSSTRYAVNLIPGFYYQPLPKLLISADFGGLGYSYSRNKSSGTPTSKSSNVYFNLMSSFTFGVDFILGKKG